MFKFLFCIIFYYILGISASFNTLRPRQNGRHFPDDIFKCISLDENAWISIKFSLTFLPKSPINNIPSLVQITAWHRSGDKPLFEPIVLSFLRIYTSLGLNELSIISKSKICPLSQCWDQIMKQWYAQYDFHHILKSTLVVWYVHLFFQD